MSDFGSDPELAISIDRLLNTTRTLPSAKRKSTLQAVSRVIDSIGEVTTQIFVPVPPGDESDGVIINRVGRVTFTRQSTTTVACPRCGEVLKVTVE